MKQVLGIGNALVDVLFPVPDDAFLETLNLPKGSMQLIDTERYREIGDRMSGLPREMATGGSACNTILALASMGARPGVIGKISDDEYGRFFSDTCREKGIRAHLLADTLPTGVASTFITPDGQRTFGTYLGAAARMTAGDIRPEWLDGYGYFYAEGYLVQNHELIERAADLAREHGLKMCLDLASYNIVEAERDFFAHLLTKTDIVFANEEEARAFTGKDAEEALGILAGICGTAVVKTGPRGAMAQCGDRRAEVPALPVDKVTDTTAAGDFFAAGFLYAHASGGDLTGCLHCGTILATEVIQTFGTKLEECVWEKCRKAVAGRL